MTRIERIALAMLGVLTIARLWWCDRFGLSPDEAYYTLWSQHLDLAYYSKGPGVALVIRGTTALFGHSELGVRIASPLLALTSSLILWRLVRRLFDGEVAGWCLLVLNLLPLWNVGALLMTIDPLSIVTWLAAMTCAWQAFARGPGFNWWWPATGACIGAGFLCKYTNAAEMLSVVLFLALAKGRRRELLGAPFASCLAAFLPFAIPPLLWNARHDWVTLTHLSERGGLDSSFALRPKELLEFLVLHFGVYSPVVFALMLWSLPRACRVAREHVESRFLLCFALPLLAGYCLLALQQAGEANWTGPGCVSLLVLGVAQVLPLAKRSRGMRWLVACGLGVAALLSLVIVNTDLVRAVGLPLRAKSDPSSRLRAWKVAATEVDALRARLESEDGRPVIVVANHYGVASALAFHARDGATQGEAQTFFTRPTSAPRNQFWFWQDWRTRIDARVLYLTDRKEAEPPAEVRAACGPWRTLTPIVQERNGDTLRTLSIWTCEGSMAQ